MDSLLPLTPATGIANLSAASPRSNADALIISATFKNKNANDDALSTDLDDITKSLTITAQKLIAKLNELLKKDLPDGIESLKPEDHTAEKTAERIVSSIGGSFDAFVRSRPDLDAEEVIEEFMSQVRKGVDAGYGDAYETLEGLGAFEFEGVREGVEQTKIFLEQKLAAFEAQKRIELGLDPETETASNVQNAIFQQAGAQIAPRTLDLVA